MVYHRGLLRAPGEITAAHVLCGLPPPAGMAPTPRAVSLADGLAQRWLGAAAGRCVAGRRTSPKSPCSPASRVRPWPPPLGGASERRGVENTFTKVHAEGGWPWQGSAGRFCFRARSPDRLVASPAALKSVPSAAAAWSLCRFPRRERAQLRWSPRPSALRPERQATAVTSRTAPASAGRAQHQPPFSVLCNGDSLASEISGV